MTQQNFKTIAQGSNNEHNKVLQTLVDTEHYLNLVLTAAKAANHLNEHSKQE